MLAEKAFARLREHRVIERREIPILDLAPPDDTVPMLARMYHWSQGSAIGEAYLPFRLADMMTDVEIATSLVGLPLWQRFFGTEPVAATAVVPMQLRMLIFQQLVVYEGKVRGTKHCFQAHHHGEMAAAQAALDAASPQLAKMKGLLQHGACY